MSNSSPRDEKRGFVCYPFIPTGEFLGKCLDSIMEQGLDRSEYEVLVHDGGSTDKTMNILRTLVTCLGLRTRRGASKRSQSRYA